MRQKVLLIDDSESIHALVRARLHEEPVDLICASDGDGGLQLALSEQPDLILLDVEMPEPDGMEVCRHLKRLPQTMQIPIILLTGMGCTNQKLAGLELGAMDFVAKPFDPADLRARVRVGLRMKYLLDLLATKAQVDGLSGLWNRRYFDERLESELSLANRSGKPLSCVIADIDGFGAINERWGQRLGDAVIRHIAQVLLDGLRREDVLCRYDGEEFALLLPNTTAPGAAALAERMRQLVVAAPPLHEGQPVPVTCSFGVADLSQARPAGLVQAAIRSLRAAQATGCNAVATPDSPVAA